MEVSYEYFCKKWNTALVLWNGLAGVIIGMAASLKILFDGE
jgi:hypothetical protein